MFVATSDVLFMSFNSVFVAYNCAKSVPPIIILSAVNVFVLFNVNVIIIIIR